MEGGFLKKLLLDLKTERRSWGFSQGQNTPAAGELRERNQTLGYKRAECSWSLRRLQNPTRGDFLQTTAAAYTTSGFPCRLSQSSPVEINAQFSWWTEMQPSVVCCGQSQWKASPYKQVDRGMARLRTTASELKYSRHKRQTDLWILDQPDLQNKVRAKSSADR